MLRKTIALVLSTSLVLVGASFAEDAYNFASNVSYFRVATAQAVTTTAAVTLSTSVQAVITLTLASSTLGLGALTPGTPIFTVSTSTVATNNSTGFTLAVNRNTAGQTMLHTDAVTAFPDATSFNGSNATTTNVVGANLHFKVAFVGTDAGLYNSTTWGPNDTDGASNAKYAGIPPTIQNIAATTTYVGSNQLVVSRYRLDAPTTQKTGVYSGGVTYTAYTNP